MFTKNINDFKTSKSNKLSKFFAISYQETSHAPPPPERSSWTKSICDASLSEYGLAITSPLVILVKYYSFI